MFDQILESYRRAAEQTLQVQQMMLRSLTSQWPQLPGVPNLAADFTDQAHAAQSKWADTITEMLNKHRESLDAQYKAGIKTIDAAFRTGEARDPAQFRRLTEELWKQSFDCLKTVGEAQMRDVQAAMQKFLEVTSQGVMAGKM